MNTPAPVDWELINSAVRSLSWVTDKQRPHFVRWIRRFVLSDECQAKDPAAGEVEAPSGSGATDVCRYLRNLALVHNVAASTWDQTQLRPVTSIVL